MSERGRLCTALTLALLVAGPAGAACRMAQAGSKCVTVPQSRIVTEYLEPGERIPEDTMMLLGTKRRGLPPVDGYWRYYEVDGVIYRVHPDTLEVIARVGR